MAPQELVDKVRDLLSLWRNRKYEQLAAACCLGLVTSLIYVVTEKDVPVIGHRSLVISTVVVLLGCCVTFLVWRLARLSFPSIAAPTSKLLAGAVRGPLPFAEADGELFLKLGRKRVVQELLTLVLNEEIPVVVVSGESGAGKTSLLRAGLAYVLKQQYGRTCVYWDARPNQPAKSLLSAIQGAVGGPAKLPSLKHLYSHTPSDLRLLIILDQFEQLDPQTPEHAEIFDLVDLAAKRNSPHPVTWVVAFKKQYGSEWYEFQSERCLNPPHVSVKLFGEDQAESIMTTLGAEAGLTFERELLKDFLRSASVDGLVSPVDVGIGTLVLVNLAERTNKNTLRIGDYKFAGGSSGLMTAYLQDHLSGYPDVWKQEILKVLLLLFDLDRDQLIPEGRSIDFLAEKCTLTKARLANVLDQLAASSVRILEKIEADSGGEPKFRLPHERLIPAIRTLSGSILAANDQVQLILDTGYRTWLRSHNAKYLLSGTDLRVVRQSNLLSTAQLPQELFGYFRLSVRRQQHRLLGGGGLLALILIIAIGSTVKIEWEQEVIGNFWSRGQTGMIYQIELPDDKTVLSVGNGPYARAWDRHNGKLLYSLHGRFTNTLIGKEYFIFTDGTDSSPAVALNMESRTQFRTPFHITRDGGITFSESGEVILDDATTVAANATSTLTGCGNTGRLY
jgi:hypothetical protein